MSLPFLVFLLKANMAFVIGFGAYLLLLKREPRFVANRWVLLSICLVSTLLPLLPEPATPIATVVLPPLVVDAKPSAQAQGMPVQIMLVQVYCIGLVIALLWLIARLVLAIRQVNARDPKEAFSFFSRVSVPGDRTPMEQEAMRAHERVHARLWHSADVMAVELLAALSWFNPLWRWALRELRLVHEHTADAEASLVCEDYDKFLVAEALGVPSATLLNRFHTRTLKTRLIMLHRKNEPGRTWKYGVMIPVALVALLSTGWKAEPPYKDLVKLTSIGAEAMPSLQNEKALTNPEKMPEYPGGQAAMAQFMKDNLHYPGPMNVSGPGVPPGTMTMQIEGDQRVFVEFVVGSDGRVGSVKAAHGDDGPFVDEAVRVVKAMPIWQAGMDKGRAVPVKMVLPVLFKKQ